MQLIVIGSYGDLLISIYWSHYLKISMKIPANFEYLNSCLGRTDERMDIEGPISYMNIKENLKQYGFFSLMNKIIKETIYLRSIKNKIILGTSIKCVLYGVIINAKILFPLGNIYSEKYYLSRIPIIGILIILINKINIQFKFINLKFYRNKNTDYICFPDSRIKVKCISTFQIDKIKDNIYKFYYFQIDYHDFNELINIIRCSDKIICADSLPYHIAKFYNKETISIINIPNSLFWVEEKNAYKIKNSEAVFA